MRTVGIIGCGAIGTIIAQAVDNGIIDCDRLILFDHKRHKAEELKRSMHTSVMLVDGLEEMISLKPLVIVEAASQDAVKEYIDRIVTKGIKFIVLSVGALLDLSTESDKILIPSGAIGGLDAISSATIAGIHEVALTTRKNPAALNRNDDDEKVVYEGSAEEAVKLFPTEMNVAATLALASKKRRVKVKLISDPKVDRNIHQIRISWKQGDIEMRFANDPHPENPKTSALAAWSAISLLKSALAKHHDP